MSSSAQLVSKAKNKLLKQDISYIMQSIYSIADYIYSSFHSVSAMLNQLNWPLLKTRRDYLKIIMFYKIINGLVNITPTPDLTPVLSVTRGHSYRLYIPFSRIDCHLFSFTPTATKLWNSLPSHIMETNSLEEFKKGLAILMNVN